MQIVTVTVAVNNNTMRTESLRRYHDAKIGLLGATMPKTKTGTGQFLSDHGAIIVATGGNMISSFFGRNPVATVNAGTPQPLQTHMQTPNIQQPQPQANYTPYVIAGIAGIAALYMILKK